MRGGGGEGERHRVGGLRIAAGGEEEGVEMGGGRLEGRVMDEMEFAPLTSTSGKQAKFDFGDQF